MMYPNKAFDSNGIPVRFLGRKISLLWLETGREKTEKMKTIQYKQNRRQEVTETKTKENERTRELVGTWNGGTRWAQGEIMEGERERSLLLWFMQEYENFGQKEGPVPGCLGIVTLSFSSHWLTISHNGGYRDDLNSNDQFNRLSKWSVYTYVLFQLFGSF